MAELDGKVALAEGGAGIVVTGTGRPPSLRGPSTRWLSAQTTSIDSGETR